MVNLKMHVASGHISKRKWTKYYEYYPNEITN